MQSCLAHRVADSNWIDFTFLEANCRIVQDRPVGLYALVAKYNTQILWHILTNTHTYTQTHIRTRTLTHVRTRTRTRIGLHTFRHTAHTCAYE